MGKGLCYVDAHLITSVVLTSVPGWTLDKKLVQVVATLHIKYQKMYIEFWKHNK